MAVVERTFGGIHADLCEMVELSPIGVRHPALERVRVAGASGFNAIEESVRFFLAML